MDYKVRLEMEDKHQAKKIGLNSRLRGKAIPPTIWTAAYFNRLNANEKLMLLYLITLITKQPPELHETTLSTLTFRTGIEEQFIESILSKLESKNLIIKSEYENGIYISIVWENIRK